MAKNQFESQKFNTGKWKKTEHDRFIKALQRFGKNWNQITRMVKTRSLSQIRSHYQKFLIVLGEDDRKVIEMSDSERNKQLCKNKEKDQMIPCLKNFQDQSETYRKESDSWSLKGNKDQISQKGEENVGPQIILPSFETFKASEFPQQNNFGYFYTIMSYQLEEYRNFGNGFNNFSFLPMSIINDSQAFQTCRQKLEDQ